MKKNQSVKPVCAHKMEGARKFVVSDILSLPVVRRPGGRHLDEDGARAVFRDNRQYSSKCGCYVYGIRAAKGIKPVYVGKAVEQQLMAEALSPDKICKINKAILKTRRGTPVVAFIVPEKKLGATPTTQISEIEIALLQYAYAKNPDIENENGVYKPRWFIDGVVNSDPGRRSDKAVAFRSMVGIR